MQNCYIPQRLYRFDLMLQLADLTREEETRILDLGCGPGSLAFRALQHYPNAHVIAVDINPVLLVMGQHVAKTNRHIEFLQADIRQRDWWTGYIGRFDLVLSATSLHWLNAENLAQTYQHIYQVLKPGGRFMNSDHIASDDPEMQTYYRKMLQAKQQAAFLETRADDWDGFWRSLAAELGQLGLQESSWQASQNGISTWEGTDDGLPKNFHVSMLQQCGFEKIEFHWQELGEAIIGARKPADTGKMKSDRGFTAYCGLYCGDCIPSNQELFDAAEKLKEKLDGEQFDRYAGLKSRSNRIFNDYEVFRNVLSELIKLKCGKTCINGGGKPDCRIRECVHRKGLEGCWECSRFEDCELLEPLSVFHGDTPKNNLRLIRKHGVDNWADKRGKHYLWSR